MEKIVLLDTIKDKDNIIIILGATEQADLFDESIRFNGLWTTFFID